MDEKTRMRVNKELHFFLGFCKHSHGILDHSSHANFIVCTRACSKLLTTGLDKLRYCRRLTPFIGYPLPAHRILKILGNHVFIYYWRAQIHFFNIAVL